MEKAAKGRSIKTKRYIKTKRSIVPVDGHSLAQEGRGLSHERRQYPGRVEAGAILDDDDRLALLQANGDGGGGRLPRRPGVGDNFKERHLLHGAKVVHADNLKNKTKKVGIK